MKAQSVEVLNEADRQQRILDWMLFCQEVEFVWSMDESQTEWHPGDPIYIRPWSPHFTGMQYIRHMIQELPINYFHINPEDSVNRRVMDLQCLVCEVWWQGQNECWVCGQPAAESDWQSFVKDGHYISPPRFDSSDRLREYLQASVVHIVDDFTVALNAMVAEVNQTIRGWREFEVETIWLDEGSRLEFEASIPWLFESVLNDPLRPTEAPWLPRFLFIGEIPDVVPSLTHRPPPRWVETNDIAATMAENGVDLHNLSPINYHPPVFESHISDIVVDNPWPILEDRWIRRRR